MPVSKGGPVRVRSIVGSAALFLALFATGGCGRQLTGSGTVVEHEFKVGSFSRLQVSSAFQVRVSIGKPPAVVVRVDDNLVDQLAVGVAEDGLRIGLEPRVSVSDATLEADVTAPSLAAVEASGLSTIHPTDPIESKTFALTVSGASRFMGSLAVSQATAQLSGASSAIISGSASGLTATVSGASRLQAGDMSIDTLTIDLSGASHAEVDAGTISVAASGASNLTYRGSPKFTRKDVSGASAITPA
jgi:hypothetical protein